MKTGAKALFACEGFSAGLKSSFPPLRQGASTEQQVPAHCCCAGLQSKTKIWRAVLVGLPASLQLAGQAPSSLLVGHRQTFWFSFYASADNLAHSNATRPAGRNFTVTALRPIKSAIRAVRAFW